MYNVLTVKQSLTFVIESFIADSFGIFNDPLRGIRSTICIRSFNVHFCRNDISLSILMDDTDRVYGHGLIKLIANEIFACSAIVPSVRKPVGTAFVVKCAPGFVTKVTWAGESFGGFSLKRYPSVFVTVEFDIFYYPWSWEVCFVYDSPEFVSCCKENAVLRSYYDNILSMKLEFVPKRQRRYFLVKTWRVNDIVIVELAEKIK